ncbi:unnamed protein product [Caenorhabditis bovis]|uniref:Cytochrome b5 heme-binding domain-containing protein n=1 Tax=Caenorhabditis bovis TaxID=2654633 RepID=A0A8S1F8A1_9PELO|nr:unnamed protein product [Caenorhabditis bovis]
MTEELREIKIEEVQKNNNENDEKTCWIIMNGKVYDVTQFIDEHPGGGESILEYAGIDATEAFNDIGHSSDAIEMTKEYLIGKLVDQPEIVAQAKKEEPKTKKTCSECFKNFAECSVVRNIAIPTAIGIAAYLVYSQIIKSRN